MIGAILFFGGSLVAVLAGLNLLHLPFAPKQFRYWRETLMMLVVGLAAAALGMLLPF